MTIFFKLWALRYAEKLSYVCKRHFINIKQWDDEWGSWRAGIDWYAKTGDCTYIVEQPKLKFCLNSILGYMEYGDEWLSISHFNEEYLHLNKITHSYSYKHNKTMELKGKYEDIKVKIVVGDRDRIGDECIIKKVKLNGDCEVHSSVDYYKSHIDKIKLACD